MLPYVCQTRNFKASCVRKVQIICSNYLRCAYKWSPHFGLTSCCLSAIFSARDAFPNLSPISEIFQRKIKSQILGSVCNLWNATPTVDWLKRWGWCLLTKDHKSHILKIEIRIFFLNIKQKENFLNLLLSKVAINGMSNYIDRLITAESLDNYGVKSHQCQAAIIMSMIFLGADI